MTRPQMVRADTIDLQDHVSPSAQDHSHLHSPLKSTAPNAALAPHQAETLRTVAVESEQEKSRSPRSSWANGGEVDDLQIYAQDLASGVASRMQQQQQQDTLAIAQNGGHMDDDTDMDDVDDGLDDDMMDKISSSPSIEDEDIDFDFVYALHTFVATVEGQANATKGDTMVLLDDSNSYWWLVRVVKDNSIGYLPAEHIETPTERLARLNKHRNIDLSATMLGDQAEKPKNPLKSAMRRRKAKTVTFADPTIHAYSDYSSEEEDDLENEFFAQQQQQQQQQQNQPQQADQRDLEDESAQVQPLNTRSQVSTADGPTQDDKSDANSSGRPDDPRTSDEILEIKSEPSRSRNGTVRNTDSFFKDETVETKKITLTPNLLRDDNEPRASSDSKELRSRPSLDKLEKDDKKDDKKKKEREKKDREKKPGVIRSLFSRGKDKKKAYDEDGDFAGKRSFDVASDAQEKVSEEFAQVEEPANDRPVPQRHPSKLQKHQPRGEPSSPTRKPVASKDPPASTIRMANSGPKDEGDPATRTGETMQEETKSSQQATGQPNGVRMVPHESSETPTDRAVEEPEPSSVKLRPKDPERNPSRPHLPGAYPDSYVSSAVATPAAEDPTPAQQPPRERLSESPVQVSPINNPPALVGDTSSQEGHSSPSSSPSPELVEAEDNDSHRNQDSITTSTSTGSMSQWNDANLRAFFDSGTDIRDLLNVVYDKSDVAPAGPDHPIVGTLFKEPNAKLAEITTQLDNMLGDWLARKQRTRGSL